MQQYKTKNIVPVTQKAGKEWTDEQSISIPYNRTTKSERLKDSIASKILSTAMKLSNGLQELYNMIQKAESEITAALKLEGKIKSAKGNFTWYNFNRSIKIEVSIDDIVTYDQAMIAAAREKLETFLEKNTSGTDNVVRQLLSKGFYNKKGAIDRNKLVTICSFRGRIKDNTYQQAVNLIEQAQSITSTKKYYRVWVKDDRGEYVNVNLQFSNV